MGNINWKDERNLSLLTDFYELTMANGYLENGMGNWLAGFDLFFRKAPDNGGFAIMGGLSEAIKYINNLHFDEEDIEYLKSSNKFSEQFLNLLRDFRFTGDIWGIPDGTPIFPTVPLMKVVAPIVQAQLVETMLLMSINAGSLFTTKANRIVRQLPEGAIALEFGARRAQGYDVALNAPKYAYIGGFEATSSTLAGRIHDIPVSGTMAHSWVMSFDSELEAFETYCKSYPDSVTLLVDTYDTLRSGVPNAIKAFDNILKPLGKRPKGIRLDSGDLADLSIKARKMLDEAGYPDCKISASNSLDEEVIVSLISQGAKIDGYGVGERFATAKSDPVFGAVYKLAFIIKPDGALVPKMKFSENPVKTTNPSNKKVYRLYDKDTNKAIVDVITLEDEIIDDTKPYTIFDPVHTYKEMTLTNFYARPLLEKIFDKGKLIYHEPTIHETKKYCLEQVETIHDGVKRLINPHRYFVDLSKDLWDLKHNLILAKRERLEIEEAIL